MIIGVSNLTSYKIDKKYFQKIGEIVLKKLKQPQSAEVSLVFVGDAKMKGLNKKYRGKNKTTDVLSFAYGDIKNPPQPSFVKGGSKVPSFFKGRLGGILGEIVISVPQAKKQAKERSYPLKRELLELFVHGILHLVGYKDETEKEYKRMLKKQEEIVKFLGFQIKS